MQSIEILTNDSLLYFILHRTSELLTPVSPILKHWMTCFLLEVWSLCWEHPIMDALEKLVPVIITIKFLYGFKLIQLFNFSSFRHKIKCNTEGGKKKVHSSNL